MIRRIIQALQDFQSESDRFLRSHQVDNADMAQLETQVLAKHQSRDRVPVSAPSQFQVGYSKQKIIYTNSPLLTREWLRRESSQSNQTETSQRDDKTMVASQSKLAIDAAGRDFPRKGRSDETKRTGQPVKISLLQYNGIMTLWYGVDGGS